MEVNQKVSIHNRFDVKLIRDGVVIKSGFAENIVLDRMYSRLVQWLAFNTNICFGSGAGSLSPLRTTLFSPVGYKAGSVVERVYSSTISKVTKKVVLNPSEYVGVTFTEVGVSDTTNAVNTHALIKDSEGNLLSLTKTDLDVLEIYSTIFFTFAQDDGLYFSPGNNSLLQKYLLEDYTSFAYNTLILLQYNSNVGVAIDGIAIRGKGESVATTVTFDVSQKWRKYSGRAEIGVGNFGGLKRISAVGLGKPNDYQSHFIHTDIHEIVGDYLLENVLVGNGDGVSNIFPVPHENIENIVAKVDGVVVPVLITYGKRRLLYFYELVDYIQFPSFNHAVILDTNSISINSTVTLIGDLKTPMSFLGYKINMRGNTTGPSSYSGYAQLHGSNNGIDWVLLTSVSMGDGFSGVVVGNEVTNDTVFSFIKVVFFLNRELNGIWLTLDNPIYNAIELQNVPALGSAVTADYTVPYLPKDENYVLDVEIKYQFGENS